MAGQIGAKMLCVFSKQILTNIEIARSLVVRFAPKPPQVGFDLGRAVDHQPGYRAGGM